MCARFDSYLLPRLALPYCMTKNGIMENSFSKNTAHVPSKRISCTGDYRLSQYYPLVTPTAD